MGRLPILAAAVLAMLSALGGCSLFIPWSALYTGSGTYVSRDDQVRITKLQLDHAASGCYTLSHLGPDWEWWIAIRVEPVEGPSNLYNGSEKVTDSHTYNLYPQFVPHANIQLTLVNEAHEQLFSVSGPLDEWEWNWNRAVKKGRGEECQSNPGTWRFRRFDVGPDQAWGTSFVPQFSKRYSLCYKVITPARPDPETAVWLVAETYTGSP